MMEAASTSETLLNVIVLMMEAGSTFETLVSFHQTSQRYN
jgi:hypothetical protein